MKKKPTAHKKENKSLAPYLKLLRKLWSFVFKHRFLLVILILSVPVFLMVRRSDSYLNPRRDQATYDKLREDDKKAIEKYQSVNNFLPLFSSQDQTITPDLPIGRQNPFTE